MAIRQKRSLTPGSIPTTSSLQAGELAINVPDGRLFLRKSGSGSDTIQSAITTGAQNSGSVSLTGSLSLFGTGSVFSVSGDIFEISSDIVEFTGSFIVTGSARVTGSLSVTNGITGSLQGTSSWATNVITASYVLQAVSSSFATSAANATTASYILNAVSSSFAATASSAENFLVRGTLTAQTIVAQVITSSTDFVTGSTRFGSLISNTHQFTGSVGITGSLTVIGFVSASSLTSSTDAIINSHTLGRGAGGAVENTAFGFQTLIRNTTATRNTAIGWFALSASNAAGASSNTAVGAISMRNNLSGTQNSAFGEGTLFSNTSGQFNTAVGYNSLASNTDGGSNVAVGWYAGDTLGDGATANTTADNSIYIGYSAFASQSNGQNEIVIGASNVGHGSNTVTLGNSSITRTILRGTVSASGDISGSNLYAGLDVIAQQNLKSINSVGDEGGEILLAKPQTNTTLTGSGVTIDIYQNRLRFFEQGGAARGYFIDITGGGAGVSTNLVGGGGGTPGGSTTQIQYNNGGAFGGVPTLTYDGTTLRVTGSFTGSLTGSLLGTASFATSASWAPSAGGSTFPFTGSAVITGSLVSTGSLTLLSGSIILNSGSITVTSGLITVNTNGDSRVFASTFRPTGASGQNIFIGHAGTTNSGTGASSSFNTSVGAFALDSNTTGFFNTAFGNSALDFNTAGSQNTAVGYQALQSITTGTNNTAIGGQALSLVGGSQNVAIGSLAGINIAGFATASVYVGYNALGLNSGISDQTNNEIVIGANNTGLGSNTVVLGNSSITKTLLRGNVGIGITSPSTALHVVGAVSASAFTGSLFGTASFAISASWAPGGGGGGISFPYTGSAVITGSLVVTGSFDLGIAEFNSTSSATTAGTTIVSSYATASYNSAFYNYYISSGSNARAGQIMSVWSGSTINYTEVTTTDLGNTNTASFAVTLATGNVRLSFTAPGVWTVRSIVNLL
jgi:hypothetical protein